MSSLNHNSAPESYSWSDLYNNPSDSVPPVPKSSSLSAADPNAIPVIDMADPDAVRLLSLACETWGAFQVIGHNVPHYVLENISSEARRLFALPTEEKMKIARAPGAGTMEGYGSVHIQSFFSKQFWAEGFSSKSNAQTHQMASKLWSDDSTFCNAVKEYRKEMDSMSTKLVYMLLLSLGLTEEDIKQADPLGISMKQPEHLLQLNWYPACPEPEREMGMAHHCDSGIITMLYNNTIGLQVLRNEDQHGPARWVTVPLVPDSFIVLVGDLGHMLSNGRFHSVLHRAMVNQTEPRLSVVYFWYPPDNVMVSPLVSGPTGKPVFRAVTWPDFLDIKRRLLYKAVDSFKLNKVEEEKKDGSSSEVEEGKKMPKVEEEKKDDSASALYKTLDSIKLVEVKEEKKGGSRASEEKNDVFSAPSASEEKEEKKDGFSAAEEKKDSFSAAEEKEDKKDGFSAAEEKKNDTTFEVGEEKKMTKLEEEEKDVSTAAGCV